MSREPQLGWGMCTASHHTLLNPMAMIKAKHVHQLSQQSETGVSQAIIIN